MRDGSLEKLVLGFVEEFVKPITCRTHNTLWICLNRSHRFVFWKCAQMLLS